MWSLHHRYTYNKSVNILNGDYNDTKITENLYEFKNLKPESSNNLYTKLELRNLIVPASACSRIPWILETPKSIRESAVFEACKNLKSGISNIKNGHIKYFNIKYKSKKLLKWTIGIPKESIKIYENGDLGIYEKMTTMFRLKTTESITKVNHDCTIHFDGLKYYICVPEEVWLKTNTESNWFCSLDPGLRKFQTIYSPDNDNCIIIGEGASTILYKNLIQLDRMLSKPNSKTILKIKKLRNKIMNLQMELHYKCVNFLCRNYKNIYIPKLTKRNDIISISSRKIHTKTVRNMVVLGHCKFVERLKTKAGTYKDVKVHVITEEYTSQKCLSCKKMTKTKCEKYVCNTCNFTIDRDVLGSTNILLKNW